MGFKSVRSTIVVLAGSCILLAVAALLLYATVAASRTQATVEMRTESLIRKAVDERLIALASAQVGQIQRQLDLPLTVASTLATTNELMGETGSHGIPRLNIGRDELSNLVGETLGEYPALFDLYIGWEPNAFDVDRFHAGREADGYDANGRFLPLWYRNDEGGIEVEPLAAMESETVLPTGRREGEYYLCVKESRRPCVVPTPYELDGETVMLASFNVPLMVDGEFRGIAGSDLSMDFIQELLSDANAGLYEGAGDMTLVSSRGELVGYTQNAERLGEPVAEVLGAEAAARIDGLTGTEPLSRWDSQTGLIELYVPFEIGTTGVYWTLLVQLPEAAVLADLNALQSDLRSLNNEGLTGMLLVGLLIAAAGLVAIWLVGSGIARPLRRLAERMRDIASGDGDLTQRLPVKGRNETAELALQFNAFADKMHDVLCDVRDSSDSVRVAAAEIARGSQDLSGRTETAAANLQQTSASMDQLTSTVENTAESSRQANQLSLAASEIASKGGDVVSQVVATMNDIDASSRQVSEIVTLLDGIAFQTNLLALNASVEAARAGEQGRGFAVVASEVRQLASHSADAARQIKTLVEASSEKTRAGAEQVRAAGQTMDEIVASVARVTDVLGEISAATHEQSQGIGQVNQAVAELDHMTQQNAAMVEESATAADRLKAQSVRLTGVVGAFRLAASRREASLAALPPAAAPVAEVEHAET